jgi:hypothetical protein
VSTRKEYYADFVCCADQAARSSVSTHDWKNFCKLQKQPRQNHKAVGPCEDIEHSSIGAFQKSGKPEMQQRLHKQCKAQTNAGKSFVSVVTKQCHRMQHSGTPQRR